MNVSVVALGVPSLLVHASHIFARCREGAQVWASCSSVNCVVLGQCKEAMQVDNLSRQKCLVFNDHWIKC
eukprot:COSAG05_NODE_800_length_7226_cov_4.300126_11_plen_70_part_00